jgi:ribosomal protein L37E
MVCKSQQLESHSFVASDGYNDIHHTCRSCGTHFNHLDGETYARCDTCHFPKV